MMNDLNNLIINTKLKLANFENSDKVRRYFELSNSFDCIRYIFLVEQYFYWNSEVRESLKDDIKNLELYNDSIKEYTQLYKDEVIVNYLSLKEKLLSLELDSHRKAR